MQLNLCSHFDLAWSMDHEELLRAGETPPEPAPKGPKDSLWRGWFIPVLLVLAFMLPIRLLGQGSGTSRGPNPLRSVSTQRAARPVSPVMPVANAKPASHLQLQAAAPEVLPDDGQPIRVNPSTTLSVDKVPMPAEEPMPSDLEVAPQAETPPGTLPLSEKYLSPSGRPAPKPQGIMGNDMLAPVEGPQGWETEGGYYPAPMLRRHAWGSRIPAPGAHSGRHDPNRHLGLGDPLEGTSWLNRPISAGVFAGGIFNSNLINGHVLQNNASLIGFRVGWDFDHYWGTEFRYGFANPNTTDINHVSLGDSNNYMADVSLLYYPLGDTRWRPYGLFGLGQTRFSFKDEFGGDVDNTLFGMPVGFGMKYFATPSLSGRVEFLDNVAFGSGNIATQNNFSITMGLEYRFGGKRPMFYPWHGAMSH